MSCNGCSFNNSTSDTLANSYDWLNDLPDTTDKSDIVEVKFKTTRKEYFRNLDNLPLKRGDKLVVATSPGHDVGEVTLTGYLAEKQFKRRIKNPGRYTLNTVYRKASEADLEKLKEARGREKMTMIRARQAAADLGLDMKIGDVEFRGDNKKAIFYYIAEGRVDFRELIRVYAHEFRIKVEMKQIGARQEAGLVGGIGSCGRELCCSSWRTDFSSISSDAALKQGLSPSAQKMAGACGKLKCCLLYELDTYIEARNEFPRELLNLEIAKGIAKPFKTDYLKKDDHGKLLWLSFGIDLVVSSESDREASFWEEMFLPDYLMNHLAEATKTTNGVPLVKYTQVVYEAPPNNYKSLYFISPFVIFSILTLLVIAFSFKQFRKQKMNNRLDVWIYGFNGFVGIVILWLVLYSEHPAMRPNYNLLWALPLNFVFAMALIVKKWRSQLKYYHLFISVWMSLFLSLSIFIPQYFHPVFYLLVVIILSRSIPHSILLLRKKN